MRGVAGDGAQIEPVLQQFQPRRLDVDDGDVVRFRAQALGDGTADLARAQYDDFQRELQAASKRCAILVLFHGR